ncbi:2-C-methyl-D-erythritol 2,4-cyclodiphosphate synthase [Spiroplasma gladiatoris]|uniref:2-C-methyl-D-erythritol 2,4-cyclodiphosphate synthase n=1 Tax=Spiroplasma gladiatoris TaxID=2143 RepID=A0A4P7AKM2_9MOLU|nr:2-C-methyl-D-erythritol 2,4-cyclodiphosphate synthase [Spiroplasma gladiatoris]QBQ08196.1 2-C-methyl-D-erythritol 2,4-cyclodiphosphate synthase [Spiroplasma gladiatoris]
MYRIGFSKDTHIINFILKNGVLGGVVFKNFPKMINAYSDGDVLLHSLCEAFLGAMGLEDLGTYYNKETKSKNFSSLEIVNDILNLLKKNNYLISNIDVLIELEKPNLKDIKPTIKSNLASIFKIKENQISIKATSTEKRNYETITVYSNVLIYKGE